MNNTSEDTADDTTDVMRQRMSEDDRAQWDAIQEWKDKQLRPSKTGVIVQRIRSYVLAPLTLAMKAARKSPVVPPCSMPWSLVFSVRLVAQRLRQSPPCVVTAS